MNPAKSFSDFGVQDSSGVDQVLMTVSSIALNFDYTSSDPATSRADEIKVLLVKNKRPSRKAPEGKPGGFGLPTGQVEGGFLEQAFRGELGQPGLSPKETMDHAVQRETEHETGYAVTKIIGKAFIVQKQLKDPPVRNEIHIHVVQVSDWAGTVQERDEIDATVDPWFSLRSAFSLPPAQGKNGTDKNPDGMYFSHRQRLYRAIEAMLFHPEDLVDGEAIKKWLEPNRESLRLAMSDLAEEGLLDDFLPQENSGT